MVAIQSTSFLKAYKKSQKGGKGAPVIAAIIAWLQLKEKKTLF
jgi:hypothetical protein